jgi:hypothetical protein
MILEEMIEFVRESDSNGWRSEAVIAALRAGQEIARTAEAVLMAVDTRPYVGGQQVQNLLPPYLQDPLQEAWEAYYAATKGEE